jgi:hypothetical protein
MRAGRRRARTRALASHATRRHAGTGAHQSDCDGAHVAPRYQSDTMLLLRQIHERATRATAGRGGIENSMFRFVIELTPHRRVGSRQDGNKHHSVGNVSRCALRATQSKGTNNMSNNTETYLDSLDEQIANATNECESASSYADDCKLAAIEAEDHADNAYSALSDMESDMRNLRDECEAMAEMISELETEKEKESESETEIKIVELEKQLEFERARFQRVVSFIESIAAESITIDSTMPAQQAD